MSTTPRTDQTEREMDAADLKPQLRLPLYANLARNLEHECSALHELVSVLRDEATRLHKRVMTRKSNNIALDRRNKRLAAALECVICCASSLTRYKWRCGGTLDLYDSGDIYPDPHGPWVRWGDLTELWEQNRRLKDMLATLSETRAEDMQRLSDMINKRQEALRHISEIIEEKAAESEDLKLGSTAYRSVRRWASEFLHNAIGEARAESATSPQDQTL
jgi:hypothetical protein